MEKNYDFRQEMLQFHRPGLRCNGYVPGADELKIHDEFTIFYLDDSDEVLETAVKDLQDYLQISMNEPPDWFLQD